MMTLFDDEYIMEAYLNDLTKEIEDNTAHREALKTAKIMLKNGRISVEEIPTFFRS